MKALVVHGGGPTAVLNASLAGLVAGCRGRFQHLYASSFGFDGFLGGQLTDLLDTPAEQWELISHTPGSAIGSSRRAVDIVALAPRLEPYTVFLTGGNGSMRTALNLAKLGVRVVGIPKTIDNDLAVTHHSPGYISTAHFFASAARNIAADLASLPGRICVLETLGRNVGWIAAATASAPHVVLLPEVRRSLDDIATEAEAVYRKQGWVLVVACEGQIDPNGQSFGADTDRGLATNLGHTLARALSSKLGIRARSERPGLMGRCCQPNERDHLEAFACGSAAATTEPGNMVALDSEGRTFPTPLETVAGIERPLPLEFIRDPEVFRRYLAPYFASNVMLESAPNFR